MSTKIWIGDKMYLVDEPVREYVDELQSELDTANEENKRLRKGLDAQEKEMSYLLDCYQAAVLTKTCVEPWIKERATEIIKTEIAKGGDEQALKGECKQNVFMTREERIAAFHKARGEKWSEEREQWIPEGD